MIKNRCLLFAVLFFLFATTVSCIHSTAKDARHANAVGMYHGLLPCASCPGIDTWVEIFEDRDGLKFKMVERYLEEKDGFFHSTGTARLSKNTLQLQKKQETIYYLVKEDALLLLGNSPDKEGSDAYRLYKKPAFKQK